MSVAFVAAAAQLSWLCFVLSPVALIVIFWYSLAKRYTWATQFFLGLAMAIAPVGGWLAAGGGRGMGAVAARPGDRAVGRRASTCCTPARISTWIDVSTEVDSGAIRRRHVAVDLARDACRHHRVPGAAGSHRRSWVPCTSSASRRSRDCSCTSSRSSAKPISSKVKLAFDLNGYVGILYFVITAISVYAGR